MFARFLLLVCFATPCPPAKFVQTTRAGMEPRPYGINQSRCHVVGAATCRPHISHQPSIAPYGFYPILWRDRRGGVPSPPASIDPPCLKGVLSNPFFRKRRENVERNYGNFSHTRRMGLIFAPKNGIISVRDKLYNELPIASVFTSVKMLAYLCSLFGDRKWFVSQQQS